MLQEKAGELAGKIWSSLNENGAQTLKQLNHFWLCTHGKQWSHKPVFIAQ